MYTVHRRPNLRSYTRLFAEEVASDISTLPETNSFIHHKRHTYFFFTFCDEGFLGRQNKTYFCRLLAWKYSSTLPIYIMLSLMHKLLRYGMQLRRYFHSGHCTFCYSLPLNSTKDSSGSQDLNSVTGKYLVWFFNKHNYHKPEIIMHCDQSLLSVRSRLVSENNFVDNSQTDKSDYPSHFVVVILLQCFYSVQ